LLELLEKENKKDLILDVLLFPKDYLLSFHLLLELKLKLIKLVQMIKKLLDKKCLLGQEKSSKSFLILLENKSL